MAYRGKYQPSYPRKYKGDPTNIVYRSLWERKFMVWCDKNTNILEWGSEEIIIPYKSPVDSKWHRYFPDFYIKLKNKQGIIEKYLIEVKPHYQVVGPKVGQKKTKTYINEVKTFAVNKAKWKAAEEFCLDRQWKFKILTENELGIK